MIQPLQKSQKSKKARSKKKAPSSKDQLPNSMRVYVAGQQRGVRVPFREVALSPTRDGEGVIVEVNEPVRLYDCSGPWGDPRIQYDIKKGLSPLRRPWVLARGDVKEYEGRKVRPMDNGYLSPVHAEFASKREASNRFQPFPGLKRQPLRARTGCAVTQLYYARRGIVTPEMEFIA